MKRPRAGRDSPQDHAARLIAVHFRQEHLNCRSPGFTVWPHFWQRNHPSERGNIALKLSPSTHYGHRISSAILSLPLCLAELVRQFDPIRMLLFLLVLFSKNLF